jgi:hypothetical protein
VIDGVQWGSPAPSVSYKNSILAVAGVDVAITASISFGALAQVPGVYALSYQHPVGGSAIITMGGKGWGTAFPGGAGTLTITALTAHRAAGSFLFTAEPASGGATGTVSVTNGKFDIRGARSSHDSAHLRRDRQQILGSVSTAYQLKADRQARRWNRQRDRWMPRDVE